MNKGDAVKGGKNHIQLPIDDAQKRRGGEGQHAVGGPVGGGRERDRLGPDLGRIDLRHVRPGRGTPGDGEGGHEQVGAGQHRFGYRRVVYDHPVDGI